MRKYGLRVTLSVLILLALGACQAPQPAPTETPTVPPTATQPPPTPTATPEPAPPVLADRYPVDGELIATDDSIDLYFDQPMDQASVEAAFAIEPEVDGALTWIDRGTLRFTPDAAFELASRYTVSVSETARSAAGLALETPINFNADTVGFLEITQVLPEDGSYDVDVLAPVTVMFNRPVVPLGLDMLDNADLPTPITLDPPVAGQGRWINTSIYQFVPAEPLQGGTAYFAEVAPGLADVDGGLLTEGATWSFITASPQVTETLPYDGEPDMSRRTTVRVAFNQPMNQASVENALDVTTSTGTPISGSYEWNERSTYVEFTPAGLLPYDTRVIVRLASTASTVAGNSTIGEPVTWSFSTVGLPAVQATDPFNGANDVDPRDSVYVYYQSLMDEDSFDDQISVEPEPGGLRWYVRSYDGALRLEGDFEARTTYTVTIGADVTDVYGTPVGEETTFTWTTGDLPPYVYLNTPGLLGQYDASKPTRIYLTHRNISSVDLALYTLPLDQFFRFTGPGYYDYLRSYVPDEERLLRRWTETLQQFPNETAFHEIFLTEDAAPLAPGLYYLRTEVSIFDEPDHHILMVSDSNLTAKLNFNGILGWMTDLESGQPLSGRRIDVYDEDGVMLGAGITDADGLLDADMTVDYLYDRYYLVSDEGGFALAMTSWDEGIGAWDFGLSARSSRATYQTYLYTDRPLYRPGQDVELKIVIREETGDTRYSVPFLNEDVTVLLRNDTYDIIHTEDLTLNSFGTFATTFSLAEDAGTGYYSVELLGDTISGYLGFQVAEYRKPEYQVAVTPDRAELTVGEDFTVDVDASFFFGGPVPDADVNWVVLSRDYSFPWDGPNYYSFSDDNPFDYFYYGGYYGYAGESIANGSGTTDASGRFTADLTADIGTRTGSQVFTFEATISDVTDQPVSERTTIIVHAGDRYIGVRPLSYLANAGQEASAELILVDWDQDPIAGQSVELEVYRREWFSVQEEDEFGNLTWEWSYDDTLIDTASGTTGSNGLVTLNYVPTEGGTYRLRAVTRDGEGREIAASAFQWVTSRSYVNWRQENNNRIELIADKRDYAPGDTAEILIPSPFQEPVQALVTVERGSIFSSEVITLETNSTVYTLPILPEHAPNIYVSVTIVAGVSDTNPVAAFRYGLVELPVSNEQQALTVTLTPDRDTVGPRDEVTYTVEARDYAGNPVQAEFSLGLADLAALSLADPNSGPILDAFYREQPLGVRTAVGLVLSVDALNLATDEAKGGGGGGGDGLYFEVRSEFRDTAYWNAFVETDENGLAEVTITLPDNLTTWRLDARGITRDTLVGQETVDIVATKPLLIRPLTPRFFIVGDEVELGAVINNNTGSEQTFDVQLSGSGVTLLGADAQSVTVADGAQVRVAWPVIVNDEELADLTFAVQGGGFQDASKPPLGQPPSQHLPIYRYTAPDTVGSAGIVTSGDTVVEAIALPRRYDANQGSLDVTLSGSLAGTMTDGLDYLAHFEHECTEQTVSRFLPNLLTFVALRDLDLDDPALESELRALVGEGIQKLVAQQHSDGGWGWFVSGQSNPYVSAYVVYGLQEAGYAGFTVPERVLERGYEFLLNNRMAMGDNGSSQLLKPAGGGGGSNIDRLVFIEYVLAYGGRSEAAFMNVLYDDRDIMTLASRAFLAMAYNEVDPGHPNIVNLLSQLATEAELSASGVSWHEPDGSPWNMDSDLRTTAIILRAFAELDPSNSLLPNTVRWLMVAREAHGGWATTQETAWSLMALTSWLRESGELNSDYAYSATLNGNDLATGNVDADTLRQQQQLSVAVSELLGSQANRLAFSHEGGQGQLYYTAFLSVYQDVEDLEAINRGIVVTRSYTQPDDTCGGREQDPCPFIDTAAAGETFQATLTIIVPNDQYYVEISDWLPAGAEVVNTALETTSVAESGPSFSSADPLYYGWGWWWFTNVDIRDEKVSLYADYLPSGTYQFTYTLNASLPGTYNVIPPHAQAFYMPDIYGRGDGGSFTITPGE